MNWSTKYSADKIKQWGLPATKNFDLEKGIFSDLLIKWSELPDKKENGEEFDQYFICADVLIIDEPVNINVATFIFARRIEIAGNNNVLNFNRTEDINTPLLIVCQEAKDPSDENIELKVRVEIAEEGSETILQFYKVDPEPTLYGSQEYLQVTEWSYGSNTGLTYNSTELDKGYFWAGEPLHAHLTTIFQLATLLSTEQDDLSIHQYQWVAGLAQEGKGQGKGKDKDTKTLGGRAASMAANLMAKKQQAKNVLLVPYLDYALYSESANAFLKLLQEREGKYNTLLNSIDNVEKWKSAAEDILDKNQHEEDLNSSLLKQAKDAREQVLKARTTIAKQIAHQRLVLFNCECDFKAGIEIWKRDKIVKNALKIVEGSIDMFSAIPALVITGPEIGVSTFMNIGTTVTGFVLDEASKNTIGSNFELSSTAGAYSTEIIKKIKNYRALKKIEQLPILMGGQDNERILNSLSEAEINYLHSLPVPQQQEYEQLLFGPKSPVMDAGSSDIAVAKLEKMEVAKRKSAANAKFNKALGQMKGGADKIANAVENIIATIKKADSLKNAAQSALLSTNDAVDVAMTSFDLKGLDVVTGGAQLWDNLALELDNFWNDNAILLEIFGGSAYRTEFRRLLMLGKVFAQTKLAVAKADADLAEKILRERASKAGLETYQKRIANLDDKIVHDQTLAQLAFGKILEAKIAVYMAVESYQRAFMYYTLNEGPALPKLTSSIDAFNEVAANITGKLLPVSTLKNNKPQSMKERSAVIPMNKLPRVLFLTGGCTLDIDPSTIDFRGFFRWRIRKIQIFADGLDPVKGNILVHIKSSGHYLDLNQDEEIKRFASLPYHATFSYNGETQAVDMDTELPSRMKDDFFLPTPFSKWTIKIEHQNPLKKLDFNKITQLRIKYDVEASAF